MDPNYQSIFEDLEANKPIRYASPGQRFLNYIIDVIVFYVSVVIVTAFYAGIAGVLQSNMAAFMTREDAGSKFLMYIYMMTILVAVYTLTEGFSKGRTLGKLITGTRAVRDERLAPISFKDALLRSLCRMVPFEPLSAFGGHPWHDRWTKTIVIKTR